MIRLGAYKVLAGAAVGVACVFAWVTYYIWTPLGFPESSENFEIASGTTLRTVSRDLAAAGVIPDALRFELLGRALQRDGALKAGNYQLDARWSPLELLDGISGKAAQRLDKVVFVEGWSVRQIRSALNAHESLRHDTTAMTAEELLRRLDIPQPHPEGLFFPDTYHFARGTSDIAVLRRAASRMQEVLVQQWAARADDLPMATPYEALILASIIEKETGQENDRPMVAAVLINRLRKGMRLQVDPTVIYGLGADFDGNLRRRDLERDSPYNTYLRAGLPPTPIAVPGLASIAAAVKPAKSSALYFVARGDGSSHFSDSLPEHNRAVTKYQLRPDPQK
jgi:UPF0755 protein